MEDRIAVPESLGRSADFLLTVRGDSMIEAGILDGDTLVVRKQDDASNGDWSLRSSATTRVRTRQP